MKGQYQIIENVMLFGIGVIIFIATFSIFNMISYRVVFETAHDQFEEAGLLVSGDVIEAYGHGRFFSTYTITQQISRQLSNQDYTVALSSDGVKVMPSSDGPEVTLDAYGIQNAVSMEGEDVSAAGRVKLAYDRASNKISITR